MCPACALAPQLCRFAQGMGAKAYCAVCKHRFCVGGGVGDALLIFVLYLFYLVCLLGTTWTMDYLLMAVLHIFNHPLEGGASNFMYCAPLVTPPPLPPETFDGRVANSRERSQIGQR